MYSGVSVQIAERSFFSPGHTQNDSILRARYIFRRINALIKRRHASAVAVVRLLRSHLLPSRAHLGTDCDACEGNEDGAPIFYPSSILHDVLRARLREIT